MWLYAKKRERRGIQQCWVVIAAIGCAGIVSPYVGLEPRVLRSNARKICKILREREIKEMERRVYSKKKKN